MLLSQETHTVQNLAGTGPGALEPLTKHRIFHFQLLHPLRVDPSAGRCFERLHPCLGAQRPPSEARQLITQVSHALLQLLESFDVRTFAV